MSLENIQRSIHNYAKSLPSTDIDSLKLTKLVTDLKSAFDQQAQNTTNNDQPAKNQLYQSIDNLNDMTQDLGFKTSDGSVKSLYTATHLTISSIDANGKNSDYIPHGILYARINNQTLPIPKMIVISVLKGMNYLIDNALHLKAIDNA